MSQRLDSVGPAGKHLGGAGGPLRNTLLQLAAQVTGAAFTAVLTIYLVRALGPRGYGEFALTVSVSLLVLLPSDFGLSAAVARFLAESREDPARTAGVLVRGLQLKVLAGALAAGTLFVLAPLIGRAYGAPGLAWPLRWVAVALFGQGLVYFLNANFAAVRTVSRTLKMFVAESAVETGASIAIVAGGGGVAGAALGRATGYAVGAVTGLALAAPIIGSLRSAWRRRGDLSLRVVTGYASAMMVVDAAHTALVQIDVLFIGAILSVTAAGPFAAVSRLFTFLTYLGTAVGAGIGPRLSRGGLSVPDARTFNSGLRYLVLAQGALLAPLIVWAKPIVGLVLGSRYHESVPVMRALAPTVLLGALAPVLALGVNYLGEARRRVPVMLGVLLLGVVSTYVLLGTVGVVGAAIADDAMLMAHVGAHMRISRRFIDIDLRGLAATALRTLAAALAMGLVMGAVGVDRLSAPDWILGGAGGTCLYGLVLLGTREVTTAEVKWAWQTGLRRGAARP